MTITPFKDQDYNQLVGEYDADNLFEDLEFAADYSSLYYTKSPSSSIVWRRPTVSSTCYFFYRQVILTSLRPSIIYFRKFSKILLLFRMTLTAMTWIRAVLETVGLLLLLSGSCSHQRFWTKWFLKSSPSRRTTRECSTFASGSRVVWATFNLTFFIGGIWLLKYYFVKSGSMWLLMTNCRSIQTLVSSCMLAIQRTQVRCGLPYW